MRHALRFTFGVAALVAAGGFAWAQGATSAPAIGKGDHSPSSVTLTTIESNLKTPRDLAFNPSTYGQLWVVTAEDDTVTIIHQAHKATRWSEKRKDSNASHFMDKPSALAFGGNQTSFGVAGTFATSQESNNGGNNFMGPTLWSSNLGVFAMMNPYGLGSHLDMLHCAPLGMGIAWEKKNVYWVFGGHYGDIVRFDFGQDHNVGEDDHSDGIKYHYVVGQMTRVPNVPSHLYFHSPSKMLYIADTAKGRVAKLDTTSGTVGQTHNGPDAGAVDKVVAGASLTTFVSGLTHPSGVEIKSNIVYVSDHATGKIHAYDMSGAQVNWLDTGLGAGALMGMAFGPYGKLYIVDAKNGRVLRIDP